MCHQHATELPFRHVPQALFWLLQAKRSKEFYMLQVFKLVGSLARKKKISTARQRKRESLWNQSFHSANRVSQTGTVTNYKAGPKNSEGQSLCYDGKTQPEEKIALSLELEYP